ncbi:MAG TPA: zinc ribbon domain-containing protein [Polyangiaceae bacterium]|nr:zinc ribbon domain-containing protein [Polyangiaceae bacterium]
MRTCPRCATPLAEQAVLCPACGIPIHQVVGPAPTPDHQTRVPVVPAAIASSTNKQTMIGMPETMDPALLARLRASASEASLAAAPTVQPQSTAPQAPAKTMLGMAMPGVAPTQQPAAAAPTGPIHVPAQNKTMLGVAMPGVAMPGVAMPGVAMPGFAPTQQPAAAAPTGPIHVPAQNKTMLGVAMPGFAPTQQPAAAAPTAPAPMPAKKKTMLGVAMPGIAPTQQPAAAAPAGPAQVPSQKKTMLGVAMPGIAPTDGRVVPMSPPHVFTEAPIPPPAFGMDQSRAARPMVPWYRRLSFVFVALGVSVLLVVGLFAWLWPTKPPIASQALVNEQGRDVLRLTCASCPDGTVMTVEGASATVAANVADVLLPKPLSVGDNRFQVRIDRPGSGRDEDVELRMPVSFRVRPDLTGLTADPPTIHVEVETLPGTTVLVDGVAIHPDTSGKARYPVDVTEACTGPNTDSMLIDRTISYTIQPKGAAASSGTVTVKVRVTPLTLQAPRPHTVVDTESFLVAGRTPRGATVQIEGARFEADKDGAFSRTLQIKQLGETTVRVRAILPEHAPRTISFSVKRVERLEEEANTFEKNSQVEARRVMEEAAAYRGKQVVLRGEVIEARSQSSIRVILLDATGTCSAPPCLARLLYAGTEPLSKGDFIRVFGRVADVQSAGGKTVPEIDVDFLLKGR